MQFSLSLSRISIYVLVGIAILASFALAVELLPEIESKSIVIPTLALIIGWTIFFIISSGRSKEHI